MEKRLSFEREKNGKQTADGRRISTQELVLGGVFTTLKIGRASCRERV